MKQNRMICLLMGLLCMACYDDKGNYDYNEINELEISGIDEKYSVMMGSGKLTIEPVIKMTVADLSEADRFDYVWVVILENNKRDTIGRALKLDCVLDLVPKTYDVWLKVADKQTKVIWKQKTVVTVGTPYTRGILLIGEGAGGNVEVQMLSMVGKDTIFYGDILKNSGLPALSGPIDVIHTGKDQDKKTKLWVLTKSGSYFMDLLTQKSSLENKFQNLVLMPPKEELAPIDIIPRIMDQSGSVANKGYRAVLCDNGSIYYNWVGLMGDCYGDPVNREVGKEEVLLKSKPYLFYSLKKLEGLIWYDAGNERFMCADSPLGISSIVLEDREGEAFAWNQKASGRTLVYGENTFNTDGASDNGNSFALLKKGNDAFIYKFYATKKGDKRGAYAVLPVATGFADAKFYAFSSTRSIVFYVVNNNLYAYDYNPGNEKFYGPLLGTDEITMLKFDTQIEPEANALYVATYSTVTGGVLRKYHLDSNPDNVKLIQDKNVEWSGLTKVVNMSWRATQ